MKTFVLRRFYSFFSCFNVRTLFFAIQIAFGSAHAEAQTHGWKSNPFDQKVLIENKGQWDAIINSHTKILFGTSERGVDMYWTPNGLTYKLTEHYLSRKAKREMKKGGDPEGWKENVEIRFHYLSMEWVNSNPSPKVIGEEAASNYFTYSNPQSKSGKDGIKALAYKKITYKDIYPGIDAQYILPEKGGIKYSFIIHPGADPELIKINYKGANKIKLNQRGEVEIKSVECGNYLEHLPETHYENGDSVKSKFSVQNEKIGFSIPEYDKKQTLIIDPWVSIVNFPPGTNPSASAFNTAGYDVGYDNSGNVWVYGGADPVYLAKYNSAGTLLWTYSVPFSAWDLVGDFDVNKTSGTAYVCAGSDCPPSNPNGLPAGIVKVNSAGIQTGKFNGNNMNYEISRIRLDCSGRLYMTGGGVNANLWQVAGIDTNLTTMTGAHITSSPNGDHDECLMTLDPTGNFMYTNFNYPAVNSADFLNNNEMQKVPLPAYGPATWINPGPIYSFVEMSSLTYSGIADGGTTQNGSSRINMFNGMVCGNGFFYTYNGDTLKQWNKATGTMIKQITTGGTKYLSGGLDLDLCENVYAGVSNAIKEYDANLNLITTYPLSSTTCYDLRVDKNRNIIYACGKGYVSATLLPTGPVKTLNASVTAASCSACNGTAAATFSVSTTVCALPFSYSYKWFPGGETTSSISNLCPGTYTVIAEARLSCVNTLSDTAVVIVQGGGGIVATITPPVSFCIGNSTTITASGGPNYLWNTGATAASIIVTPTVTTTYSVVISSSGNCKDSTSVTITVNPLPLSVPIGNNVCFNTANQFTDKSIGNNTILNWTWDFGDGISSTLQNPAHTYGSAGTFTVSLIVTNNSGCKDSQKTTVVVKPVPLANFSSVPVCLGKPTCFKDGSTVTPGAIAGWSWNFGDPASGAANISTSQNPCHTYNGAGSYTVILTATSDSGCQNTVALLANTYPPPIAAIKPQNVCVGSNTTFIDASTSAAGALNAINAWEWNFGDGTANDTMQNPSHTYALAGTYTVTLIVTTLQGCTDTTNTTVIIYQLPIANFSEPVKGCSPVTANYTDMSSSLDGTIANWQWSFPGGSPPSSTVKDPANILYTQVGSYSVSLVVTTNYGCVSSVKLPMVDVYPWPKAEFCVTPNSAPATDPTFTFCDMWSTDVVQWYWDFGDNSPLDSTQTDPVHSYSATVNNNDFYKEQICIRVLNQHGCWAAICHEVELIPEFTFYIPNTFTPNEDGSNEMFYGKCRGVKEYDIWVFDRWGNQLWDCHHDDKNTNWDSDLTSPRQEGLSSFCKWNGIVVKGGLDMGGNSGQVAQEDVYVWKVQLLDIFNKRHTYVGHVNIVK
jgi:gliding motility-associated-like protein